MARFYRNNDKWRDFECPNCGEGIDVETSDINLNEDMHHEVYGRCPNCNHGIKANMSIKLSYKPEILEDI